MMTLITALVGLETVQFLALYMALYLTSSLGFAKPVANSEIFKMIFSNKISLLFLTPGVGLIAMALALIKGEQDAR